MSKNNNSIFQKRQKKQGSQVKIMKQSKEDNIREDSQLNAIKSMQNTNVRHSNQTKNDNLKSSLNRSQTKRKSAKGSSIVQQNESKIISEEKEINNPFIQTKTMQQKTIVNEEIYEVSDKDEQSPSKQYDSFNIEQEHSQIVIHEEFSRQASKKAFEQLLLFEQKHLSQESSQDQSVDQSISEKNTLGKYKEYQEHFKQDYQSNKTREPSSQYNHISQEFELLEQEYQETYDKIECKYWLVIKPQHNLKWVFQEFLTYKDNLRFLYIRKGLFLIFSIIKIFCCKILSSTLLDLYEIIITLITINLILLKNNDQGVVKNYQYTLCVLYFVDVSIHFIGLGVRKYLNNFWNVYDLIILVLYFIFIQQNQYIPFDVSSFRLIRIPFYMGRLNYKLKIMLISISEALKQIVENLLILILFTILIAIVMLIAFNGMLRYRCMDERLGIFKLGSNEFETCGYATCEEGFTCARQLQNVDVPTNFDSILFSYFQTIRTSVLNDWTTTMYMLMKQFNPAICLLYVLIVFAINKFYFQLLIAVLKVNYAKTQEFYQSNPLENEQTENSIEINMAELSQSEIWKLLKQFKTIYCSNQFDRENQIKSQVNLIMKQNKENEIIEEKKEKLLSARQEIEIKNQQVQMEKLFTFSTWIPPSLFPKHFLQNNLITIIKYKEKEIGNSELFFTLKSMDFLSLNVQVINNKNCEIYTSQSDVIQKVIPTPSVVKQQFYYQIDDILKNIKKEQNKYIFPLKQSYYRNNNINNIQNINNDMQPLWAFESDNEYEPSQYPKIDILTQQQQSNLKKKLFSQRFLSTKGFSKSTQFGNSLLLDGVEKNYIQLADLMKRDIKQQQQTSFVRNYEDLYNKLIEYDKFVKQISFQNWSGLDLIPNYNKTRSILMQLNQGWEFYFSSGLKFYLLVFKFQLQQFLSYPLVQITIDSLICINTILQVLSEYVPDNIQQIGDLLVTIILVIELSIRTLIIKNYFTKLTSLFESVIILLSLIEKILPNDQNSNSFIIIMKLLKSLFFLRVIKYNTFAQNMMIITQQTLPNYANMGFFLFILILNYAIVSLQIFSFPNEDQLAQLHYFGNIYQAWIAVYDISTGDDWYGVVILSSTYGNSIISFIFCISLIFIVNYCAFGLLFVIILDGFTKYLEHIDDIPENSEDTIPNMDSEEIEQNQNKNEQIKQKEELRINSLLQNVIIPEDEEKYFNIKCEFSLFFFSKQSRIRQNIFLIVQSTIYQIIMKIILWGSLINLIAITYNDDYELSFWNEFEIIKFICNIFIILDGIFQSIVKGGIGEYGYFNSIFIIFDFCQAILYFINILHPHNAIYWILFLEYLRPFKINSYYNFFVNERGAISKSFGDIISVFYVVLLFWFIFAIFGMTIYQGKLGYCDNMFNIGINENDCKGEWITFPYNFENIFQSMLSLYQLSTLDLWCASFYVCINSNTSDKGPTRLNNQWASYIYFFLFIFIGALFLLQFFAGVIFINYFQNKQQLLNPDLTLDQELFLKLTERIMQDNPNYSNPAKKGIRLKAKKLLENGNYIILQKLSLIFNLITLASYYETAINQYLIILNIIHHILSFIFIIDFIVKLLTYNIKRYFDDAWRQFEFIFVVLAILDFILDIQLHLYLRYARASRDDPYFIYLRCFFIHRGLRMILIIQNFTRIRKLLNVIYFNKMAILRILGLFISTLTCYSYIGCRLFKEMDEGLLVNSQLNFKNFFYGILCAFKCIIENGWIQIARDSYDYRLENDESVVLSQFFYFSLNFIGARVLLNLIVSELVQEFEKFYDTSSSCLETYIEVIDKYRNIWCKYSEEYKGQKIETKYIGHFLLELGEPLGSQRGDNIWDAARHASGFQLKRDQDGCISFRNLLYEMFKSSFRESIFIKTTPQGKKIMKQNDKIIKYRLYNQRSTLFRREVVHEIIDLQSNFNLLSELLYIYMAIKAWKSYGKYFFKAADQANQTISYTESDVDLVISETEDNSDQNLEIDTEDQKKQPLKIRKRQPSIEHSRRPQDVYILPFYQESQIINNNQLSLKPSQEKQQNKLKSAATIKKKEQFIKYQDQKRRLGLDNQMITRNKYAYGYHDYMPVNKDETWNKMISKMETINHNNNKQSVQNIFKIGSRLK